MSYLRSTVEIYAQAVDLGDLTHREMATRALDKAIRSYELEMEGLRLENYRLMKTLFENQVQLNFPFLKDSETVVSGGTGGPPICKGLPQETKE